MRFSDPRTGIEVSGNAEFVRHFATVFRDFQQRTEDWIARLRAMGVKAAHPDDGWVNRERKSVFLAYPYFDDGVQCGDLIALGLHTDWRLVKVVSEVNRLFLKKMWFFEETQPMCDLGKTYVVRLVPEERG